MPAFSKGYFYGYRAALPDSFTIHAVSSPASAVGKFFCSSAFVDGYELLISVVDVRGKDGPGDELQSGCPVVQGLLVDVRMAGVDFVWLPVEGEGDYQPIGHLHGGFDGLAWVGHMLEDV
jgi:hypothetical protein